MGKTIKLTEEQIRRFFGEGFTNKLFEERKQVIKPTISYQNDNDVPNKYQKTLGHNYDSGKVDTNGNTIVTNVNPDKDGAFFTNQDYKPREVAGDTDLPGYGGAVATMADFGQANLTKDNALAGNDDNNALLERIREIFVKDVLEQGKGSTMNILDVLKIIHKIKNTKEGSDKLKEKTNNEITEDEAVKFLNSINIDYILSNFITVNAPDYVFWRLKNLSEEEIDSIEKTYGRDFHNFGQRCDGCGATTWRTTVSPYEHDDAHINFEYMGGDASRANGGKLNEKKSVADDGILSGSEFSGAGKVYEKLLPFQIHHMNENPGDNSPLNLSCLCPNCHAITGSYGKQKGNIDSSAFDILKNNTIVNNGSLNGFLNDEEVKRIADDIKKGKFETRKINDTLIGSTGDSNINEFTFDPGNKQLQETVKGFGIPNPEEFIRKFNEIFVAIYNEGAEKFISINSGVVKESYEITEDSGNADTITQPEKDESDKIGNVEFHYSVSLSSNGNVVLQLYCGEKPHIFSAFKNNAIVLTRMYYETDENKSKSITYVRNKVFSAMLNAAKEYYHNMSNWMSNAPGWMKKADKNVNVNAVTNLRPGTINGRETVKGFFQNYGNDENAARTREKKRNSQSRSKGEYNQSMLYCMKVILTAPEAIATSAAKSNIGVLGESLIDYLFKQRQYWYGKTLGRTEGQERETIKKILIDGGFNV